MRIKMPLKIYTAILHDDKSIDNLKHVTGISDDTEIEVLIPDNLVELFQKMPSYNELLITVTGTRAYHDGEDIS